MTGNKTKGPHVPRFHVPDDDNQQWQQRGLCRDEEPETWFGADDDEARTICRRCPVRSQCLEWALATDQNYGVWGGMGEKERRKLKKGEGRS